jgi:hypothetical protein
MISTSVRRKVSEELGKYFGAKTPRRWRQHDPLKRYNAYTKLYGVTSQKTAIFVY